MIESESTQYIAWTLLTVLAAAISVMCFLLARLADDDEFMESDELELIRRIDQGASTGIGEEDDQDDLEGLAAKDGILSCNGVWESEL